VTPEPIQSIVAENAQRLQPHLELHSQYEKLLDTPYFREEPPSPTPWQTFAKGCVICVLLAVAGGMIRGLDQTTAGYWTGSSLLAVGVVGAVITGSLAKGRYDESQELLQKATKQQI
jgi:hypothetical protein